MTDELKDKERLAEMQKQLDELQSEQASLELPGPGDGSTALPADRTASEATPEEIERAQVLRDPWAGQNALKILRHPPGKRLQWISPTYREGGRGMRGWTVVRHDDAIGREIHLYIADPPSRQEGLAEVGAAIRRGDVVLAWIDEGIFNKRILKGRQKANRNLQVAAQRGQKQFGKHGQSTDSGLMDDDDPSYRYRSRPGMISPHRLEDYRKAARGTAKDPRITVEGRRLFGEPEQSQE